MRKMSDWTIAVRKRMLDLQLRNNDLAKTMGVSPQYMSSVINGKVVSDVMIGKISAYLDVPLPSDHETSIA